MTAKHNMNVVLKLEPKLPKNWCSHIDASLSRQPLVKGERLVRYEVNAVTLPVLKTKLAEPLEKQNGLFQKLSNLCVSIDIVTLAEQNHVFDSLILCFFLPLYVDLSLSVLLCLSQLFAFSYLHLLSVSLYLFLSFLLSPVQLRISKTCFKQKKGKCLWPGFCF